MGKWALLAYGNPVNNVSKYHLLKAASDSERDLIPSKNNCPSCNASASAASALRYSISGKNSECLCDSRFSAAATDIEVTPREISPSWELMFNAASADHKHMGMNVDKRRGFSL